MTETMPMDADHFGGQPHGPDNIRLQVFGDALLSAGRMSLVAAHGHQDLEAFVRAVRALQVAQPESFPRRERLWASVMDQGWAVVEPVPGGADDEWALRVRADETDPGAFPLTWTYLHTTAADRG